MSGDFYILTLQYEDGRREQFGTTSVFMETFVEELERPWVWFPVPGGGMGFFPTAGLQWVTMTKEIV